MGTTLQHLGHIMTAQEFAQHYALHLQEPLPGAALRLAASMLAAQANGPLKPPAAAKLWAAADFMPPLWQPGDDDAAPAQTSAPITVAQILAQARAAGMVH